MPQQNQTPSPHPPLATTELTQRLVAAERDCIADWMCAAEALPDNPLSAAVRPFGQATATMCGIPAQVFNRVFGLTEEDAGQIPDILMFYRGRGAEPLFDINPYAVRPYWEEGSLLRELARHGFYVGAYHQMLYGVPRVDVPATPPGITVHEVAPGDADVFARVYEQVWGAAAVIVALLDRPHFRCYLANVGGTPAALGVLHYRNGVASMANALTVPTLRGRGCQTALLHQRLRDAAEMGCDLLVSQCRPGSDSQRNQLRVGLVVAGTKSWWIPGEALT